MRNDNNIQSFKEYVYLSSNIHSTERDIKIHEGTAFHTDDKENKTVQLKLSSNDIYMRQQLQALNRCMSQASALCVKSELRCTSVKASTALEKSTQVSPVMFSCLQDCAGFYQSLISLGPTVCACTDASSAGKIVVGQSLYPGAPVANGNVSILGLEM